MHVGTVANFPKGLGFRVLHEICLLQNHGPAEPPERGLGEPNLAPPLPHNNRQALILFRGRKGDGRMDDLLVVLMAPRRLTRWCCQQAGLRLHMAKAGSRKGLQGKPRYCQGGKRNPGESKDIPDGFKTIFCESGGGVREDWEPVRVRSERDSTERRLPMSGQ